MDDQTVIFLVTIDMYRDVAQLVARCAGGAEVASSSLVIPTIANLYYLCYN